MSTANYTKNYLRNAVEGASSGTILVMLFDGLVKFINLSIKHVDAGNIQEAHNYIIRSQDIVYELLSSLDRDAGGEMADNLASLYDYSIRKLEKANIEKDSSHLKDVLDIIQPLRATWKQVVEQEEAKTNSNEAPTKTTAAIADISATASSTTQPDVAPTTGNPNPYPNNKSAYGAYGRNQHQSNSEGNPAAQQPTLPQQPKDNGSNTNPPSGLNISG